MIGYYIHHHGHGHRTRAASICAHVDSPVTALSSAPLGSAADAFDDVVTLPRDDLAVHTAHDPTAHGVLHWVPRHDEGLRERMNALSAWITEARPRLLVADVSVEVTLLARLHGVPVVVLAMPGQRTDPPHTLCYRTADHLIAPWSREVYDPEWLRPFANKTAYVGGMSRFDGRPASSSSGSARPRRLVMSGGSSITLDDLRDYSTRFPEYRWDGLGVAGGPWSDDPWPAIAGADVVIGHAGQNTVADIAAAARAAVVVAEPRPFDEQRATATALDAAGIAVGLEAWPDPGRWPELIECARRLDPLEWKRWRVEGAAARAAAVLDELAQGRQS
ncbi:glycosyltransferase [Rhodococcus chondri]|uniref:Glycosyltransferase n=1 Tax=Rhodococcus chondri TaxID=3065941 RepID=A0ABU7JSR6_9NOCA|nr:glycosyltransferase [Rhodococcus sp. CC-R104]MEE2032949.1 glycosyltransferase [Rhodococcus sp. CC-R104]